MSDLVELFKVSEKARERYEMYGALNVNGRTPEDRVALDLRYRQAAATYNAARLAYDRGLAEAVQRNGSFEEPIASENP